MRILNLDDRLSLAVGDGVADVERASAGRFGADVMAIYPRWAQFSEWARSYTGPADQTVDDSRLGPPVPRPAQIFAIGVNYRDHAAEAGIDLPERPMVFTKFPAAVTGPYADIELPSADVDFEVELVAVIGRRARHVDAADGWSYVAGLTAGQDLSDRGVQLAGPPPQQYNMGKSFEGFAPIGPALVTPDEAGSHDAIGIALDLNGERMQESSTAKLVHSIPALVEYLSMLMTLEPGDVVATGTPEGVGGARDPRVWLTAGDEVVVSSPQLGELRTTLA